MNMIDLERNKMTFEEFVGILAFSLMMIVTLNFGYSFPIGIIGLYLGVAIKKVWKK